MLSKYLFIIPLWRCTQILTQYSHALEFIIPSRALLSSCYSLKEKKKKTTNTTEPTTSVWEGYLSFFSLQMNDFPKIYMLGPGPGLVISFLCTEIIWPWDPISFALSGEKRKLYPVCSVVYAEFNQFLRGTGMEFKCFHVILYLLKTSCTSFCEVSCTDHLWRSKL